jgi:hypothetical protein
MHQFFGPVVKKVFNQLFLLTSMILLTDHGYRRIEIGVFCLLDKRIRDYFA